MTLDAFLKHFGFKLTTSNEGDGNYVITTAILRKTDARVIHRITDNMSIDEIEDVIMDSHAPLSLSNWDWPSIIDIVKRGQLDHFARQIPLEDFYPLNKETDISAYE